MPNNLINIIINSIKLHFTIVLRFILILFRKDKHLKEIYFEKINDNIFDDSLLIINYSFRNAIYYKVNNKITLENKVKIFNLKNIDLPLHFIVYGLFDKKHYTIEIKPTKSLNNKSFKTYFSNLNISLTHTTNPKLISYDVYITKKNKIIETPKAYIFKKKLLIKTNSFNQNDYL